MVSFTEYSRQSWKNLSQGNDSFSISEDDLNIRLNQFSKSEVTEIYIPLVKLIYLYYCKKNSLILDKNRYFGNQGVKPPFIIGISGPVAVGKSTIAELLGKLLKVIFVKLKVQIMTTDGFIYSNKTLQQKNLMNRKGFPESYNIDLLNKFLDDVSNGKEEVFYPLYSQKLSDIVSNKRGVIKSPDILIIEGIDTLQLPAHGTVVPSDYFDFSIYVDANEKIIETWFLNRFNHMLIMEKNDPNSFFYYWANRPYEEALNMAEQTWRSVNLVNLHNYIDPTKNRANIILHKNKDHLIDRIKVRNY